MRSIQQGESPALVKEKIEGFLEERDKKELDANEDGVAGEDTTRMARKIRRPPEHHEDLARWLLTYADMITLLMLFFIILYAMSSIDTAKYTQLAQALASVFNGGDFTIFDTRTPRGESASCRESPGPEGGVAGRGEKTGDGRTVHPANAGPLLLAEPRKIG